MSCPERASILCGTVQAAGNLSFVIVRADQDSQSSVLRYCLQQFFQRSRCFEEHGSCTQAASALSGRLYPFTTSLISLNFTANSKRSIMSAPCYFVD